MMFTLHQTNMLNLMSILLVLSRNSQQADMSIISDTTHYIDLRPTSICCCSLMLRVPRRSDGHQSRVFALRPDIETKCGRIHANNYTPPGRFTLIKLFYACIGYIFLQMLVVNILYIP